MADQPRRTLKKHNLRRQHQQPPSRVDPAVESWLAQAPLAAAKLTPEELRQWKLDDESSRRPGRGLYVTAVALRVLSLVSAFIVAVLGLQLLPSFYDYDKYRLAPLIVPGVLICAWDTLEFVVVCLRKSHKGMPRLVHLPADGVICLILAASIAGFWVALYNDGYWYISPSWWYSADAHDPGQYVAGLVFLIILLLIHATFLFSFLLCSHRVRRDEHIHTPRIMYLPGTGEAVVVLARPYPPEPTHQKQRKPPASPAIDLGPLPGTNGGTNLQVPGALQHALVSEPRLLQSPTAGPSQSAAHVLEDHRKGPLPQTVPPRKPVPGSKSVGTHYATPWPPDHVPDEAELGRAARGEAQAQWMTLADPELGWGNMRAPQDPMRDGDKSDLVRGTGTSALRTP